MRCWVCCAVLMLCRQGIVMLVPAYSEEHKDDDITIPDKKDEDVADANPEGGDEGESEEKEETTWQPTAWRRLNVFVCVMGVVVGNTIRKCIRHRGAAGPTHRVCAWGHAVLEFSYSHFYFQNQYPVWWCRCVHVCIRGRLLVHATQTLMLLKLVQLYVEHLLIGFTRESVLVAPLMCAITITENLMLMGASTFTNFTLAQFLEMALIIGERVYMHPIVAMLSVNLPKWKMQLRRRFRRKRVLMTRQQRKDEDTKWKLILEDIARRTEGVEPLLDAYMGYSVTAMALIMVPFLQVRACARVRARKRGERLKVVHSVRSSCC